MWYKFAKRKFNLFGLPISGGTQTVKQFADGSEILDTDEDELQNIQNQNEDQPEIIDDTPENEITIEDVESNIQKIDLDPTVNMKLPPLHDNCRCIIETIPILSQPSINDGRRIWKRSDTCCNICEMSALAFNQAELVRLSNIGIDMNTIT